MTNTTNTGTCQICDRACKLRSGRTSLHGYKRPGCGWINGSCFGANEEPYEQSCNALKAYLETVLLARHAHLTETIARHEDPALAEVTVSVRKRGTSELRPEFEQRTYLRGELYVNDWGCEIDEFTETIRKRCNDARVEIRALDREIARVEARIASWR